MSFGDELACRHGERRLRRERPAQPAIHAAPRGRPGRRRSGRHQPACGSGRKRGAERAGLRAVAGDDRRPLLPARREAAPRHHRGSPRSAARVAPDRARRDQLPPDQGRGRRHLARQRRRASIRARRPTTPSVAPTCAESSAPTLKGLALFKTVYPGWYPGRAVHIHVKVHVGGDVVHTGQVFFRDSFTDAVYKRQPYRARGTAGHAQQRRLDLRQRREPLAAQHAHRRQRLRRVDQPGRSAVIRRRARHPRAGCRRSCTRRRACGDA